MNNTKAQSGQAAGKESLNLGGIAASFNPYAYIGLAFQIVSEVMTAITSGKAKIPAIRTYIDGVHVELGPIPVKRLP